MGGDGCGDGVGFNDGGGANSVGGWEPGQEPSIKPTYKQLDANGAPVVEQSHEYVIKQPEPNAQD